MALWLCPWEPLSKSPDVIRTSLAFMYGFMVSILNQIDSQYLTFIFVIFCANLAAKSSENYMQI